MASANARSPKATSSSDKAATHSGQLDWTKSQKSFDSKASTVQSFTAGARATEPPYSDQELDRAPEVQKALYAPLGAHARNVRIHTGPTNLLCNALPPDPQRFSWIHSDKQYSPYIRFSEETPAETKSTAEHKLWLPRELHEPNKKGKKDSGPKFAYTDSDIKSSKKKLAARPRWDSEHSVMVSQANTEVQKYVREYFDKPIRKESEGVPKVRELYAMNDRQTGWWDEASPLGEPKHTYLDSCGPWNVGGVKEQQKVSYWRTALEKSSSMPALKTNIKDSRSHLSLIERLADMPAAQATQFWREWVDLSKNRLPTAPEEKKKKGKRGKKGKDEKGDPWSPSKPSAAAKGEFDAAATMPAPATRAVSSPSKRGREEWNNRWSVCVSKDNTNLMSGHRQYFTSAQFLSGAEEGHPGAYLGLPSQKWRANAKHVTLSPSGAAGRGPVGRYSLLH